MIDIRKLKELVRLMVSNDLTELDLRDSEEQVTLRRPSVHTAPQMVSPPAPQHTAAHAHVPATPVAPALASPSKPASTTSAGQDEGLLRIESPMVGTFYSAPNPDAPPFVEVGQPVSDDTVVCIIEAMKIFNEIKAECSGSIQQILVKSGEAVEFGQPLFLVKPE